MPEGYAVSVWTIVGGVLLGLGASVNRACVLGTVANFGSGNWAYIFTPVAFYVGCISVGAVFTPPAAQKLAYGSPVLRASAWVTLLFVAFAFLRIGRPLVAGAGGSTAGRFRNSRITVGQVVRCFIGGVLLD